jgi:hypothetical protein
MKDLSLKTSWLIVFTLTAIQLVGFFSAKFRLIDPPLGDAPAYQLFIEALFRGGLDFSLGGFQGSSFPAVIFHIVYPTNHSFTFVNLLFAHLSIPLLFILIKKLFSLNNLAVVGALIWACIPTIQLSGLYGYPQGVFHFATILTLLLVLNKSRWSGLSLGWAVISKPFAAALIPIFLAKKQYKKLIICVIFVTFYIAVEILSLGKIMIGVHPNISAASVIHPEKIIYNILAAPPLLFSVHNYLPFSLTPITDSLQTSPLVIVFSLIGLFYYRPPKFLVHIWLLSFLLPIALSYLDPNYMQTFILVAILLSLPVFKKFPLLLPITIGTTSYQYLFTFLWRPNFWQFNGLMLYAIPIVSIIISLYLVWNDVKKIFRVII